MDVSVNVKMSASDQTVLVRGLKRAIAITGAELRNADLPAAERRAARQEQEEYSDLLGKLQ